MGTKRYLTPKDPSGLWLSLSLSIVSHDSSHRILQHAPVIIQKSECGLKPDIPVQTRLRFFEYTKVHLLTPLFLIRFEHSNELPAVAASGWKWRQKQPTDWGLFEFKGEIFGISSCLHILVLQTKNKFIIKDDWISYQHHILYMCWIFPTRGFDFCESRTSEAEQPMWFYSFYVIWKNEKMSHQLPLAYKADEGAKVLFCSFCVKRNCTNEYFKEAPDLENELWEEKWWWINVYYKFPSSWETVVVSLCY